ncbi:hypothetical protein M4L90_02755 [Staphylococcus equorum]|uniref:Uncharacterized protein n=1 Tax=Staphylococcus equorum TaxID=246432 RepID=A0A9X4L6R1_9STAP|nr:hypothetical protein [Staphylococcus equorum]MDG0818809.1 hypothetical protein [Staphylococcus equorum]MDG0839450.1 hypothetical protein [Staphylococcus equorum]MDG0844824.1 hypothetical protein [Staphylococcus equorum]
MRCIAKEKGIECYPETEVESNFINKNSEWFKQEMNNELERLINNAIDKE